MRAYYACLLPEIQAKEPLLPHRYRRNNGVNMNNFDKYRRMIKLFFGLLLTLALSGIYGYIFTNWLNQIIWAVSH